MKKIEKKLSDILPTLIPSLKIVSWEGKRGAGAFTTRNESGSETPLESLTERWGFVRGWRYETAPMRYQYIGDNKDPHLRIKNGHETWFQGFISIEKRGKYFCVDNDKFEAGEKFALRGSNGTYATFALPGTAQEWVAQNRDLLEKMSVGDTITIAAADTWARVEYSADSDTVSLRRDEQGFSLVVTRHKHEGAGQLDGSYRRWAVITEMPL